MEFDKFDVFSLCIISMLASASLTCFLYEMRIVDRCENKKTIIINKRLFKITEFKPIYKEVE